MKSLYGQYIEERENKQILELEHGFATYFYVNEETVYIEDTFVVPEKRGQSYVYKMADYIVKAAKSKGCTQLLGSVDIRANNSTKSLQVLFGYGMKLHSIDGNLIYCIKKI